MENGKKILEEMLPFWNDIKEKNKELLIRNTNMVSFKKDEIIHGESGKCAGLYLILSGRVCAYTNTEDGRKISLFRLFKKELCIFSASCIMKNIDFDIFLTAETDVEAIKIPPNVYELIKSEEIAVANYTNDIMSARLSDVMWVLDQIAFKSFDVRLAGFLLEYARMERTDVIIMTHEQIAENLASAREVVSRMLKYFEKEGYVSLSRGKITIIDEDALDNICMRRK